MPYSASSSLKLCLIRHGETSWNKARKLQGHFDIALNATGFHQARATAKALSNTAWQACYSSDLQRARDTAALITSNAIEATAVLRERNYGVFQGLTHAEGQEKYPDEHVLFFGADPTYKPHHSGESLLDFYVRINNFIQQLKEKHAGQTVLVVTHGGVLDMFYRIASGLPANAPRSWKDPNTAINWLEYDGQWRIVSWADTAHLSDTLDELRGS